MKLTRHTASALAISLISAFTLNSCGGGGGSNDGVPAAEAAIGSLFNPANTSAGSCTVELSTFKDDSGNKFNLRFNCSSTGVITSCTITAYPYNSGVQTETRTSTSTDNHWKQGGKDLSNITFYCEETSVLNQFKTDIIIDLMRITDMNRDADGKLLGFSAAIQTARAYIVVPGITDFPTQFFIAPGTNVTVTYN